MTDQPTPAEIEGMRERTELIRNAIRTAVSWGYPDSFFEVLKDANNDRARLLSYCSELSAENERLKDEIGKLQITVDLLEINVRTGKPAVVTEPKGDE